MSATRQWMGAFLIAGGIFVVGFLLYPHLFTTNVDIDEVSLGKNQAWQEHAKAYFSIKVPDQLTETHVGRDEIGEAFSDYAFYSSHNGTNLIGIEEMDFAPDSGMHDPKAFVDSRASLIENAPGVDISFQSADDFKGNIARRYDFYLPENKQYTKALLVYREGKNGFPNRYYTLSEMSYDGKYDDADFKTLLDSFELK